MDSDLGKTAKSQATAGTSLDGWHVSQRVHATIEISRRFQAAIYKPKIGMEQETAGYGPTLGTIIGGEQHQLVDQS
jgi:hypothetical protein